VNLDERLAARNAATLAQAQTNWDNAAEPAGIEDIDERLYAIEEAETMLVLARKELCGNSPLLLKVDRLMASAADCLISE
jgi:hypothetical protein